MKKPKFTSWDKGGNRIEQEKEEYNVKKLEISLPEEEFSNIKFIIEEKDGIVSLVTNEKTPFNKDEIEMLDELCDKDICTTDDLYTPELTEHLEILQLFEDLKRFQYQINCKIDEIIKKYDSNK